MSITKFRLLRINNLSCINLDSQDSFLSMFRQHFPKEKLIGVFGNFVFIYILMLSVYMSLNEIFNEIQ